MLRDTCACVVASLCNCEHASTRQCALRASKRLKESIIHNNNNNNDKELCAFERERKIMDFMREVA